MAISVLFQYLIDSEKKLENRFDLPAGGLQFVFSSSFPLPKSKVFLVDFMAFTGNFYDWIWFCWSPNWFDLFLPSDRAFYINGVRMALFFRHLNMTVCHGFSDNFGPKKGEILKRRRRDCGCRLFSDWLENREKVRRGRPNPPYQ